MKFYLPLHALQPQGVGVAPAAPVAPVAPVAQSAAQSEFSFHMQQIDVNLGLVNITRSFVAAFGLTSTLGCIGSDEGPRARLQCALAAASCAITSALYVALVDIRRASNGYGHAANARVDSLRYATWTVTHAVLAWLALSVRGPFGPNADGTESEYLGMNSLEWRQPVLVITSTSMIAGGVGVFGIQTSRKGGSGAFRLFWFAIGALAIVASIVGTCIVASAIHMPADEQARTKVEITVGVAMSYVWVGYPLTSLLKFVVMLCTKVPVTSKLESRYGEHFAHGMELVGKDARLFFVYALRSLSSSAYNYEPLPNLKETVCDSKHDTLPVLYTQMFEAVLAILDAVAIGLPALAITMLAFHA